MYYLYGQNTTDIFSGRIVHWVYNYMIRPCILVIWLIHIFWLINWNEDRIMSQYLCLSLSDMQMPCRQASLFIEVFLWNLEGILCRDFWEKSIVYLSTFVNSEVTQVLSLSETLTSLTHTYLGPFFLDPEDHRKLKIGAIWSLVEGSGLL
jgi:hypothetical protein